MKGTKGKGKKRSEGKGKERRETKARRTTVKRRRKLLATTLIFLSNADIVASGVTRKLSAGSTRRSKEANLQQLFEQRQ